MNDEGTLQLESQRLRLVEVAHADLEDVQRVFASNPGFLAQRPELAGAPGGYDVAAVREFWERAQLDPTRHVLRVSDRATGATVGVVDFVEWSPVDGLPWIGLVLIHGEQQRRGLGSDVVRTLANHLAPTHAAVRMAVMAKNEGGLAFARSVGFRLLGEPDAGGVVLFEMSLPLDAAAD